jgi:hypothetical protein
MVSANFVDSSTLIFIGLISLIQLGKFCSAVPSVMTGPDSKLYTGGVSEENIEALQVHDDVEVFVTLPEVLPLPSIVHTIQRLVNGKKSVHA